MVPCVGGHCPGSLCSRLCYDGGCLWRVTLCRKGPHLSPQEAPPLPLDLADSVFPFSRRKNLLELGLHILDEGAPEFPPKPQTCWGDSGWLRKGLPEASAQRPHRAGSAMVTRRSLPGKVTDASSFLPSRCPESSRCRGWTWMLPRVASSPWEPVGPLEGGLWS